MIWAFAVAVCVLLVCVSFVAIRKPQAPRRNPWREGWLDHLKSEAPEPRHSKSVPRANGH